MGQEEICSPYIPKLTTIDITHDIIKNISFYFGVCMWRFDITHAYITASQCYARSGVSCIYICMKN